MIILQGGLFQDAERNPLANGTLTLELLSDAQVLTSPYGQVVSKIPIVIQLDAAGNVPVGFDSAYASGVLTVLRDVVFDGEMVTIGSVTYTFKTALTTSPSTIPNEVLIGANTAASLTNLALAINAGVGIGTNYSIGTTVNLLASAVAATTTLSLTAKLLTGSVVTTTTIPVASGSFGAATLVVYSKTKIWSGLELTPTLIGYNVIIQDNTGAQINQEPITWVFNQPTDSIVNLNTYPNSYPVGIPIFYIPLGTGALGNGVNPLDATTFPGSDASIKINAAFAQLVAAGINGEVDARGFSVIETCSQTIVVPDYMTLTFGSTEFDFTSGIAALTYGDHSVIKGNDALLSGNFADALIGPTGGVYGISGALKGNVFWDGVNGLNINAAGIVFWADFVHSSMPRATFTGDSGSYCAKCLELAPYSGDTIGWNHFGKIEVHYSTVSGVEFGAFANSNTFDYIVSNFGNSGDTVAFLSGEGSNVINWCDCELCGPIHFYAGSLSNKVTCYVEASTEPTLDLGTFGNILMIFGTGNYIDNSRDLNNQVLVFTASDGGMVSRGHIGMSRGNIALNFPQFEDAQQSNYYDGNQVVGGGLTSYLYGTALHAPTDGPTLTPVGSGGTLGTGDFYYAVTAYGGAKFGADYTHESMPSRKLAGLNSDHVNFSSGSTNSVTGVLIAVSGALGYNVYRGTARGSENILVYSGPLLTFTDDGSGISRTLPTHATALSWYIANDGSMYTCGRLTMKRSYTVTELGVAGANNEGDFYYVNDADTPAWGDPVIGGGGVKVLVFSNGINWIVA